MKSKLPLFLILAALILNYSCTKDGLQGPEGPAGPQGATGATGATGAVGPAGADGSVIYSGTGAPSALTGKNGDYYLDRSTGYLWGPKAQGAWVTVTSLKGATGATGATGQQGATGPQGAPGSKILSGNGVPSVFLGNTGDFYLDKATQNLYGPKSTTWGTPTLLKGAQGAQGPVGPAGADGSTIYSGRTAPDAAVGKVGDYYFNMATSDLWGPKTVSGWTSRTSLKGATGATGAAGAAGANGTNGNTILSGNGAPTADTGSNGDFYLDLSTYLFYGPKNADGWHTGVSLRAASGSGTNVTAFESNPANTLSWAITPGIISTTGGPTSFTLQQLRPGGVNDTSTVFKLPDTVANIFDHGVMLVYLHLTSVEAGVSNWVQLSYTYSVNTSDLNIQQFYSYRAITNTNGVFVKVMCNNGASTRSFPALAVDKVRVVIVPQNVAGMLGSARNQPGMKQLMQQYNLTEDSFKKVR